MKMLKKAVSVIIAGAMTLTMSVSALAAEYIQLSKEPLDFVHITGEMPEMPGNPAVPIDETAYLMADDATLSISLPEGGTYFVGMAMLDFPAGSGDPGYDQPLRNEPLRADGKYTYMVYDSQGNIVDEFVFITQNYADKLTGMGYSIVSAESGETSEPAVVPEGTPAFTDVPADAYYAEAVAWAVENGITSGTSATTFSPNDTCTRAQIISFMWRAAGSWEPVDSTLTFSDVDPNAYYAKATVWAKESLTATGDTFSPNAPCTRLMAVEFMWNHVGQPDAPDAGFADVSSGAVDWAVEQGVTSGTSATTFSPNDTCTRGQIVTFLYRAFG